jgi:hypothetical protein
LKLKNTGVKILNTKAMIEETNWFELAGNHKDVTTVRSTRTPAPVQVHSVHHRIIGRGVVDLDF